MNNNSRDLVQEWKSIIEAKKVEGIDVGKLNSDMEKYTTAVVLENTAKEIQTLAPALQSLKFLTEDTPNNRAGNVGGLEKILMPMVRRKMATMVAKDFLGMQPMHAATSAVFVMKHHYTDASGPEAGGTSYPNYTFAGVKSDNTKGAVGTPIASDLELDPFSSTPGFTIGGPGSTAFFEEDVAAHMALTIEKLTVEAKSMAIRATMSPEAITDMRNYHGLNMETEVQKMLTEEITREVDTFLTRVVLFVAKHGAQGYVTTNGEIDLNADTDGRWRKEKIEVLQQYIGYEAAQVFMDTRRGMANFMIVSPKVAFALAASDGFTVQNGAGQVIDPSSERLGSVKKVGKLLGLWDVYLNPWVGSNEYICLGYHGGPTDSGLIYCPYVPLTLHEAVDPKSFAKAIGFKTRFGLVQNPWVVDNSGNPLGQNLVADSNPFYRIFKITNI